MRKFYEHVLGQEWDVDHLPRPRKERALPSILSTEEVERLIIHGRTLELPGLDHGGVRPKLPRCMPGRREPLRAIAWLEEKPYIIALSKKRGVNAFPYSTQVNRAAGPVQREPSHHFKVSIADLPSGLYVLRLNVNGTILHEKIVKL